MNTKNLPNLNRGKPSKRTAKKEMPAIPKSPTPPPSFQLVLKEGQDPNVETAKTVFGPHLVTANAIRLFGKGTFGGDIDLTSVVTALIRSSDSINDNDLKQVEAMLMSQATALNFIFGELTKRSAINLNGGGEHMLAMETYFKMAMKAQSQCRQTLETLGNIKNPPIVYAKQANIANGPQQVNNGPAPRAHADENQNQPNKLLEQNHEKRMDIGTKSAASNSHPPMEALAELNGAQIYGRQR
jgi:hypothetical protein